MGKSKKPDEKEIRIDMFSFRFPNLEGKSRIHDYIHATAGKLRRIKQKLEKNLSTAERIAKHLNMLAGMSDLDIMLYNRGDGNKGINIVTPEKSSDPVYRKIALALKQAGDPRESNEFYPWAVYIRNIVEGLQFKMENRKMTQTEYEHLQKTSMRGLLKEWAEYGEAEYVKSQPKREAVGQR